LYLYRGRGYYLEVFVSIPAVSGRLLKGDDEICLGREFESVQTRDIELAFLSQQYISAYSPATAVNHCIFSGDSSSVHILPRQQ
jgi:hypothetical protein